MQNAKFKIIFFTSLPDTAGGDGNPPVKVAPLPEDTLRCFAAGYDVDCFTTNYPKWDSLYL